MGVADNWRLQPRPPPAANAGDLPNGRQYPHGTLGAYATAKCRCEGCRQWAADYGRDRKRQRTGRTEREWSAARRRDPTEYVGDNTWGRIWKQAVKEADLPFHYTPTRSAIPTPRG